MLIQTLNAHASQRLNSDDSTRRELFAGGGFLLVDVPRGALLSVKSGLAGLWSVLSGEVVCCSGDARAALSTRHVFASDSQRHLTITTGANGRCVGVVATQGAWAALLYPCLGVHARDYALFPGLHDANRAVRRHGVRLLRAARAGAAPDRLECAAALAALLHDLQHEYQPLIERCPGHSCAKRRAVFMRLQRARNCIALDDVGDVGVGRLALAANYSVWRFIKVFCMVYGDTPYACVLRTRAERARRLLQSSDLAVGDIGRAAGFDSRSAFTRTIKQRFGQSASAFRCTARLQAAP